MAIPQHISFITLGARDLPLLRHFYRAWGWTERDGGTDEFVQFQVGSVRMALYPIDLLRDEAAPGCDHPTEAMWCGFTLAINVEDRTAVDEGVRTAVRSGARLIGEPTSREWGGYSGYIADPEGNRWEIAWLPGYPLPPAQV